MNILLSTLIFISLGLGTGYPNPTQRWSPEPKPKSGRATSCWRTKREERNKGKNDDLFAVISEFHERAWVFPLSSGNFSRIHEEHVSLSGALFSRPPKHFRDESIRRSVRQAINKNRPRPWGFEAFRGGRRGPIKKRPRYARGRIFRVCRFSFEENSSDDWPSFHFLYTFWAIWLSGCCLK